MTNSSTGLTDQILHFLYSNVAFQQLDEAQQLAFLNTFEQEEKFRAVIEVAMTLQESIQEVEATMPKILEKDRLFVQVEQRELLKAHTIIEGNVYHVPFAEKVNYFSPFIICIQLSETMAEHEVYYKGLLLPLFSLCVRQKRDLIIIPFNEKQLEPIVFKRGLFTIERFRQLLYLEERGEARIVPVIEQALELLAKDLTQHVPEVMFITDNQFTDFDLLIKGDFEAAFLDMDAEVSVIAMSEIDFEVQPIPFANKVFYVGQ